jgi:hypothetical protein
MKNATAVGGDMLVMAGAKAKVVAEFVMPSTEALRRDEALVNPAYIGPGP